MTKLHETPVGKVIEFLRVLEKDGMTKEHLEAIIRQPELAREVVKLVISTAFPKWYSSPEQQIVNVRAWNVRRGWGFTEADFEALGNPPQLSTNQRLDQFHCVVLVPYLETARETFEQLWAIIEQVYKEGVIYSPHGYITKDDSLTLVEGVEHKPGLRWVIADLAAHYDRTRGCRPRDWIKPSLLHAEALAAVAQHPNWGRLIGQKAPNIWLGGYRVRFSEHEDHCWVPTLSCHPVTSELRLDVGHDQVAIPDMAIPISKKSGDALLD